MLKRICDRCNNEMELDDFAPYMRDIAIAETQNGSVVNILDVCPKCMSSFKDWLHNKIEATKTVSPIDFLSGSDRQSSCFLCECGSLLLHRQNYCSTCGKKVDWDNVLQADQ